MCNTFYRDKLLLLFYSPEWITKNQTRQKQIGRYLYLLTFKLTDFSRVQCSWFFAVGHSQLGILWFLCSYCSDIRNSFFESSYPIDFSYIIFRLMIYIFKTAPNYQIIIRWIIEAQRIIQYIWKWFTLGKSSLRCGWTIYYFRLWRRKRIKKETHVDCYFFLVEKFKRMRNFPLQTIMWKQGTSYKLVDYNILNNENYTICKVMIMKR